ncbi:MAG: hypothetical protein IAG10_07345 [Planctomycetaceae bacterium]|nr:hypothetical protein [Planctomycetaceae bacterium]
MNPSIETSSAADATSNKSAADAFCESVAKGAGMAVGGAIVGATIAFILCPTPESLKTGAAIGRKIAGLCGCGGIG